MLYISNCHWAYHSNNIMTWASFQRHKTSQTVQTEPRQGSWSKGFSSQVNPGFDSQPKRPSLLSWLSSIGGGTLGRADLLMVRYPTVELWKGDNYMASVLNPHLCKGERFLVVKEEVMFLLLIVFPYWAAIQQLGHLVLTRWALQKLLKPYLVPIY